MNLFVRRDQFFAVGGFNEKLVTCEDVDLSYRIKKYGKILSDNKINVVHLGEASTIREFIYRKKSGFVPPFARWLTYQDFNKKVRDILLVQNGYITEIAPVRILDELLSDALNEKKLGFPILNFLWAALFAEMWIQEYKQN